MNTRHPTPRETISNVIYSSFGLCFRVKPSPVRQNHKQFALYLVRCQCECTERNETGCCSSESKCRLAKYEKKLFIAASHRMNLILRMRIYIIRQVETRSSKYIELSLADICFFCALVLCCCHRTRVFTQSFFPSSAFFSSSTFVCSIIKVMDQMESHSRHLHLANLFLYVCVNMMPGADTK